MQAERYFGTYARFNTLSKKDAAILLGADNPIGDVFEIVFQTDNGVSTAWMKNRFGALIGFLDAELSRQLSILAAREWKLQALLSFVAFTDHPEPGHYWGQVAIICYDSNLDQAFKPFIATTAQRLSDGVRPEIDVGEQGVEQVISSNGNWTPKQTVAFPPKEAGTVIMKSRRKMSEKLIEQGRKGNKGCYAVSWLFLLALVALALFSLKSCGAF